jgi:hypothetical protein
LSPRTLAERRRRARIGIASAWLALFSLLLAPSLSSAQDSSVAGAKKASSITFDCVGSTSDERSLPSFASRGETKFEVSATFGEGAIVALVNPESDAVLKPLYDAETTTGHLSFGDGQETTIVWTRMSGVDGVLVGEAIMSDGDVLALTIEQGSEATQRPFVLFAAAPASLFRGSCGAAVHR